MRAASPHPATWLVVALVSAAGFGTAGSFASALMEAGWTPAATTTVRLALGGLLLAPIAAWQLRGRYATLTRHWRTIAAFGLIACAGTQLLFFLAITRLPVGIALLIEYLAPVLVVGWTWATTRVRPGVLVGVGTLLAIAGLLGVIDVFGEVRVDPLGVLFGLGAAACLGAYFVISADSPVELPPLTLAAGGLLVGAAGVGLVGALGLLPMRASLDPVTIADTTVPAPVSVLGLGLLATALAYLTGIIATRHLGSRLASFVGLTEVLFAAAWAWLLLGQSLRPTQLAGGVVIIVGVLLVRLAEPRARETPVDVQPTS
ncbi:EamA family transporter [Naumannella cuiyingiana]|nr:EamA family transporter [Naumannella cuiyingiana]